MAAGSAAAQQSRVLLLGDDGGTLRHIGSTGDGRLHTNPWGPIIHAADLTPDDSDKFLTVPAGDTWLIHWIEAFFTATSTAGTRTFIADIRNAAPTVIGHLWSGITVTANNTATWMWTYAGLKTAAASTDVGKGLPWPLILPAGYNIRVYDNAVVDDSEDDLLVTWAYSRLDT